ncbi:uncharacterized protein METZ01_LOCUS289524, partial [marine metagenome]
RGDRPIDKTNNNVVSSGVVRNFIALPLSQELRWQSDVSYRYLIPVWQNHPQVYESWE